MRNILLLIVLVLMFVFVGPVAAQDGEPDGEPVDVVEVVGDADESPTEEPASEEPAEEPVGGPIVDGFDTMALIVVLIALGKLVERWSPNKAPEKTWQIVQVVLSSFFTLLGPALGFFDVELPLNEIFTEATSLLGALLSLLTVLIGSGVIYTVARKADVPLLGYSRSDASAA